MRSGHCSSHPVVLHFVAATIVSGCSLPVENRNLPDRERLYSDPATMEAALTGAIRTWINTRQGGDGTLTLVTMADSYTAPWNNFSLRLMSSEPRAAWPNDPSIPDASYQVEAYWYAFYSAMSTANDLLLAIRKNGVSLDWGGDPGATRRTETTSLMLQGIALAMIAMNYDSGFVATEATAPEDFDRLPVLSREQLRDTALARFEEAVKLAESSSFTTRAEWLGLSGGPTYTSAQLARLMRTMGAELLAMMPRNGAENRQVDWARVANWASRGISTQQPFEFTFVSDWLNPALFDLEKAWSNEISTMRVDTRVAHLLSPNQMHPWPAPAGNPQPDSPDRRVGDGSWGPEDDWLGEGTVKATPAAGTDFAWAASSNFPASRGLYHRSNIWRVRYHAAGYLVPSAVEVPLYTPAVNDLLWAEGLIRSNGDRGLAAALINKTRVGRGGLRALTGAEPQDQLLAALQYEQEIEMMDIGANVFYNRRRIDGLQPFTPRQMPMPYKELDLLRRELYTYGGPDGPDMSASGIPPPGRIRNVHDIAREINEARIRMIRARRRW